jgi:hypothetical protein
MARSREAALYLLFVHENQSVHTNQAYFAK